MLLLLGTIIVVVEGCMIAAALNKDKEGETPPEKERDTAG